ncbi:DNA-invertase [Labrys miyagiensis]|uniref:DNA-invertase n=1 Tax=Labrys miyagiensis TaxID=346912 RepID=A0ABQ6CTV8_9HYPH|nr:recombinase family protein [Labrys miyagiensis]GLS23808.1 DNA-invertase [Labrys miyagiensis]
MLIGCFRVSTDDKDLSQQRATQAAAGCTKNYEERISGAKRDRPELRRMLDHLRDSGVVMITRLDRLARSTKDLLDIAELLNELKAGLCSLREPWADTTSPAGRMVVTVSARIAEFERALIHQRTSAGRSAARNKGVKFGRPPALKGEQITLGQKLLNEGLTARQVAKALKVHPSTIYRVLRGSISASDAAT